MKNFISWVEIPTSDFDRAVKFYSEVFKMELKPMDFGTEKMACFPNGEGAISYHSSLKPSKNGVLVSFNAGNDLDETIKRAETNGGTIVIGKTKIEAEGKGYFATLTDTEGNTIGLYGDK